MKDYTAEFDMLRRVDGLNRKLNIGRMFAEPVSAAAKIAGRTRLEQLAGGVSEACGLSRYTYRITCSLMRTTYFRSAAVTTFWESADTVATVHLGDYDYSWRDVMGVPIVSDINNARDNQVASPEPFRVIMRRVGELRSPWIVRPDGSMVKDETECHPAIGARAQAVIERVGKFDTCRAQLLHGPPGGGKSVAARQILRACSKMPITLSPRAASDADVWEAVHEIRPDGILVDDIDSVAETDDLLSELVRARAYAKIIVSTANTIGPLRGALKRCGRASDDDPIRFDEIDDDTAQAIAPLATKTGHHAGLLAAYLAELESRLAAGVVVNIDDDVAELLRRMDEAGDR